jgi:hypothetical protein
MVTIVKINKQGQLTAIKEVSDQFRTFPYNWDEKPQKFKD